MRGRRTILAGALLALAVSVTPALAREQSGKGRCIVEAAKAGLIGSEINPKTANIVAGTEGDDVLSSQLTSGVDVVCGFGGNDLVSLLGAGDLFLGGAGDDRVFFLIGGTFAGGEGDDSVIDLDGGTFDGGPGNDAVHFMHGGTFNGGPGTDFVVFLFGGTFNQD